MEIRFPNRYVMVKRIPVIVKNLGWKALEVLLRWAIMRCVRQGSEWTSICLSGK